VVPFDGMPLLATFALNVFEGFGPLVGDLGDREEEETRALSVMVYTWDIALKNERIQRHEVCSRFSWSGTSGAVYGRLR
jgi:hypothetical protein